MTRKFYKHHSELCSGDERKEDVTPKCPEWGGKPMRWNWGLLNTDGAGVNGVSCGLLFQVSWALGPTGLNLSHHLPTPDPLCPMLSLSSGKDIRSAWLLHIFTLLFDLAFPIPWTIEPGNGRPRNPSYRQRQTQIEVLDLLFTTVWS
jgi:hypothetical protein